MSRGMWLVSVVGVVGLVAMVILSPRGRESVDPEASDAAQTLATSRSEGEEARSAPTGAAAPTRSADPASQRLLEARSPAELAARLRGASPVPEDAAFEAEVRRDLERAVQWAEAKLRAHQAQGQANALEEKRLTVAWLAKREMLLAFLRRDFYLGDYPGPWIRSTPYYYEACGHTGDRTLVILLRREGQNPTLDQLRREVEHETKVTDFKSLPERTRRRVLRLREASLRDGDTAWLASYFPPSFVIDEPSATIH